MGWRGKLSKHEIIKPILNQTLYPKSINKGIDKSILHEEFLKISFSENGEDEFIRSFFWNIILNNEPGQYLDIGCFDESLHSNTKLLSSIGWNGIAIDANPDLRTRWEKKRIHDKFYNLAVTDSDSDKEESSVDFYRFHGGEINTIKKEVAKEWIKQGFAFKDIIRVPCQKLDELARMLVAENPEFQPDLVSIDIEQANYLSSLGSFLEILSRPQLICMEWTSKGFNILNFSESNEYRILSESGYTINALTNSNLIAFYQNK